jgi:hypothetical protein
MRTFDRLTSTSALAWLRVWVDRLRRAMRARGPWVRWGLILVAVLGLAAAGYRTAMSLAPVGYRYLDAGRVFSSQDLIKIGRALHAKGIEFHADKRKVEVPADQYDPAMAVYAKLDVGPHPFDELRDPADSWSLLDTPDDREWKRRLSRERFLEAIINKLDGVVSSLVSIQYPRAKGGWHSRPKPSAFVYLETEADRRLPSQTVQLIPSILIGYEAELSHEAITMVDADGRQYLDPRNPALVDHSLERVREEEHQQEILEKLTWIPGVQVWVELIERRETAAAAVPVAAAPPEPLRADRPPALAVNQPMELKEPGPPAPPPAAAVHPPAPDRLDRFEHGRVLIYVPRSFYYTRILPRADHHEPSLDELHVMAARTKVQILKAVSLVVPASWAVDVDTIPDDVPPARPTVVPGSDTRGMVMDWGIVASVAAAIAVVAALGSWIPVARRPPRPVEPAFEAQTRRYRADSAAEPGPSERVRELVRRDPEAAASVLQRWTAQGGPVS